MTIFERRLIVPLHVAVLLGLLFLCLASALAFYIAETHSALHVISAGLVTGLFVSILQYSLEWFTVKELSRLQQLRVKTILNGRNDREYYAALLDKSVERVYLMGATASRFLEDFSSSTSNEPRERVLLAALQRGVEVRLLVASKHRLAKVDAREKFPRASRRMEELKSKFNNFSYRYYDSTPSHAILIVDGDVLAGPIFDSVPSKDTPTIHIRATSPFAKTYIQNFEAQWNGGFVDS